MDSTSSDNIVKPINSSNKMPMMVGAAIVIVLVGLGVGFFVSSKKAGTTKMPASGSAVTVTETEAGLKDVSAYKTGPIGTLQTGGIQGEGTYHLDRPGGASQTVYLNSTTVDMSKFVGKKVQVWGDTIAGQHAQWLMDVVRIQISQ
jgi:hypothetical protein